MVTSLAAHLQPDSSKGVGKREGATPAKTGFTDSIIGTEQLPELPEPIPVRSAPGQALSYGEEEKVNVLCGRRKKEPFTAKKPAQGGRRRKGGLCGGEELKKE